jgi:uncharacterized protein YlbG (UPF0298 family)
VKVFTNQEKINEIVSRIDNIFYIKTIDNVKSKYIEKSENQKLKEKIKEEIVHKKEIEK